MADLVDARTAAIYELGLDSLQLSPASASGLDEAKRFREGLVDLRRRAGLYPSSHAEAFRPLVAVQNPNTPGASAATSPITSELVAKPGTVNPARAPDSNMLKCMKLTSITRPNRIVITAMVTPFRPDGAVDLDLAARLVDRDTGDTAGDPVVCLLCRGIVAPLL